MKKNLSIFRFIRLMIVLIFSIVGISSCTTDDVTAVEEQDDNLVVFDFTSASELTAWGLTIPANGSGTNISSLTKLSATVTATNAEGANPARIWATNSGVLDLRIYNGDALTFTTLECHTMETLEFLDWATDGGLDTRYIYLCYFFCIDSGMVGQYKTNLEIPANSFHL